MKKVLKKIAFTVTVWTAAEFVTMWRMQPTRMPLKEYTKLYFSGTAKGTADAHKIMANASNAKQFGSDMKDYMFKKFD
jgi:hypothetical protein